MRQVLRSRSISVEDFLEEFFETLTPGILPRSNFISWEKVQEKTASYNPELPVLGKLSTSRSTSYIHRLAETLLSSNSPSSMVRLCFELLGHTSDTYVSRQDLVDINQVSERISGGDSKAASQLAEVLYDMGLARITGIGDIHAFFLGCQIGLESNRRKNTVGSAFTKVVGAELSNLVQGISRRGIHCQLVDEVTFSYKEGGKKKVDFALKVNGKYRFGMEANFYTTSGSKPTEIKRSYADVQTRLERLGIELIWITDGFGYTKMRNSLADAFSVCPNIYNLNLLEKYFIDDIVAAVHPYDSVSELAE